MSETLDVRHFIAKKVASYFEDGAIVNLGIGIPVLCADYMKGDIYIQAENGMLGVGPILSGIDPDAYYFDAAGNTVDLVPGASIFDVCTSFGMIRTGRIRTSVLGAFQVSQYGDLANWARPGSYPGMGGAMDLCAGMKNIIVATEHCAKDGSPKIVERCTLPLTGVQCVKTIVTELAVFTIDPKEGLTLRETREGVTVDEIREKTGAPFAICPNLHNM